MHKINGIECEGSVGGMYAIFGRGGCHEKIIGKNDGTLHIYREKDKACKVRDSMKGSSYLIVQEIIMVCVSPVQYGPDAHDEEIGKPERQELADLVWRKKNNLTDAKDPL